MRNTAFSSGRSINRYYDPSTDQFLSVDPDVQSTDQPYAFVNDDPLNAEDPLGLSWWDPLSWSTETWENIAAVASVASFIPGLDVVAAPLAIGAASIAGTKNVSQGSYVAAAFDFTGAVSGGLSTGFGFKAASEAEAADQSLNGYAYLQPMLSANAARDAAAAVKLNNVAAVAAVVADTLAIIKSHSSSSAATCKKVDGRCK